MMKGPWSCGIFLAVSFFQRVMLKRIGHWLLFRSCRNLIMQWSFLLTTQLTKEQLSDFQAVVFTDINLEHVIEFNDYCHSHQPPIAFIKAEVRGFCGLVFCDFELGFTVLDVDGVDPHTGIIYQ
ncbi:hypothetical protein SAY86_009458 [Trapa natans]|uniref:Uncharacterized protein n=1 Tax=Trapa natans TaxID=22666 RepID=A0AAN7KQZ5_TRANT|nr:hypothetical protein SAY86_009458 [Trapa natans]